MSNALDMFNQKEHWTYQMFIETKGGDNHQNGILNFK